MENVGPITIYYVVYFREFMENVGPITSESERKKAVSAKQVVQEIMSNQGGTSERSAGQSNDTSY